ncbi:sugar/nucleoside kinase (ribokinase family) [Hydrogenispora ethanolica]|uniref:Sugar/nucleoside kinase (Ribokinase family) n=1 Tax=Hydrogenispora ethanolica TaxID=1082276 RepID=A0A4R1R307_HYDET|nr:hypothetical protein [Hydrogenispora ethanolica]TCL59794.1 sugar/nucleoside kinase (ribokinase family) [Hydrogenispora ethanolica]
MSTTIDRLIAALTERQGISSSLNACIGFDGYIDEILRVVKSKKAVDDYELFATITEFSEYIRDSAGKSSDTELFSREVRFGGNAPLMANALAGLGVRSCCIGTFGSPEQHPAFANVHPACALLSVGEPGYSYSFEFDDGKLMFGKIATLDRLGWESIKEAIGLETLRDRCVASQLLSFVNWSSIQGMNAILTGLRDEILLRFDPELLRAKVLFFDIADPSRRTREDLLDFLALLTDLAKHCQILLGLNERESRSVADGLGMDRSGATLAEVGRFIFDKLGIDTLTIHGLDMALCWRGRKLWEAPGFYVASPRISTGGGDNFNAGFCLGRLLGLAPQETLMLANATASYYIQHAVSPDWEQLVNFLAQESVKERTRENVQIKFK